ncbi:MAG: ATP synthase F1 subunit epsilon [Devosia sp. 67-54]|uniref:F0F1 ATP synthase subunit epsilon n=1 Tax=unclassified Devosia TaxID=196773 RepID=UPI00096874F4|nr:MULTISPECIES: F0F1 ATP synthase subunit epsilon [unclassified Devosia]MBN9307185.1 F0F1 ATP synthase subunit epsilon [Devosia sp.]OJX19583.1 MAG: ATP synthase F1 subunit epsilon [Devosia sp. 67-54]
MADGVKIEIVSPERLVISQQVASVTVPGSEGYFTVLGEHAPLMSVLKPGFITVTDLGNVAHVYYVSGGFADVAPNGLTILAEDARPVADFNRTEIEALIASGQTELEAATTAAEQDRLTNQLNDWRNLLVEAQAAGAPAVH